MKFQTFEPSEAPKETLTLRLVQEDDGVCIAAVDSIGVVVGFIGVFRNDGTLSLAEIPWIEADIQTDKKGYIKVVRE